MVRLVRKLKAMSERKHQGRSSRAYSQITDTLTFERKLNHDAKKRRLQEEREEKILASDSKRKLAAAELEKQELGDALNLFFPKCFQCFYFLS